MKQYTDKVAEEKEKKESARKSELDKNANEDTAQTIEFRVDTDGS